ncbi:MAG: DHCW motif cupin fold protein [Alphaproteobacteria bacterium]|nr:DHCW motif cupin fold protein [Alphaproteobacteria bacterium]
MELSNIPFTVTDWSKVPKTEHKGETGTALWRTLDLGCVRIRMVEYSAGYSADHWCKRGHILFVLHGELVTELEDGRMFTLTAGMSYEVQHDGEAHRSQTNTGVTLFIVD